MSNTLTCPTCNTHNTHAEAIQGQLGHDTIHCRCRYCSSWWMIQASELDDMFDGAPEYDAFEECDIPGVDGVDQVYIPGTSRDD